MNFVFSIHCVLLSGTPGADLPFLSVFKQQQTYENRHLAQHFMLFLGRPDGGIPHTEASGRLTVWSSALTKQL